MHGWQGNVNRVEWLVMIMMMKIMINFTTWL